MTSEPTNTSNASEPVENRSTNVSKLLLGVLGVAAAVFVAALILIPSDDSPPPAEAVSGFEFALADGSSATLSDYQGKPTVVNFFASWCGPCRAELPDFEAVHQEQGDVVTFLGINHDLDKKSWLGFVENTKISYQTGFQPNQEIFLKLKTLSLPSTAFIAADGTVQHVHSGVLNKEQLEKLITTHL